MDKEIRLAKAKFAAELALKKQMHKGEPGYTPVKGVEELQKSILDLIRVSEDGKDAVVDYEKILRYTYAKVAEHVSKIPRPKDGKPGKDGKDAVVDYEKILRYTYAKVAEHVSKIPRPKDGKPGKDGKDAVVDIEALVQKVILALPKQKDKKLVIDRSSIEKLIDERVKRIPASQPVRIAASTSSLRMLTDVNLDGVTQDAKGNYILGGGSTSLSAGTNITITGTGTVVDPYVISSTGSGLGDMTKSVYDPNTVNGDAFDMENMVEGATKKILTADERTILSNTSNTNTGDQDISGIATNAAAISALDTAKVNVADIVNTLTSTATDVPLSAAQGKALKDLIDTINALLASDETNLDTLQEIVDFIELNREDLDSLTIASIAGLQTALDTKQVTLVSGSNIKTINSTSILGSGNINTPDTTYSEISESEITTGTASTLRTITARRLKFATDAVLSAVASAYVSLTGNQAIDGIKTFSSSPIVPTPTSGTQAANKGYADGLVVNKIDSDPTGVTGADQITNIISLTQAEYDAITPDAATGYWITDAA